MVLDPRTLAIYTTAISLLLAALAYAFGHARRVYPGYHWWVASLLLFALAISSIGLRGLVPPWVALVGPTALGMASLLAIAEGHRRFSGASQAPLLPIAVALITLTLMTALHDPANPLRHRAIGACGVGLLGIVVGWQFLTLTPAALRRSGRWCALLLGSFGLIRFARGLQFTLAGSGFDVLAPQISSILSYAANAVFATLWGFGFMMLCTARLESELEQSRQSLRKLSRVDPLTGLLNRRAFFSDARAELARSRRYPAPLTLLMIDIDYFKSVNDEHGHLSGDQLLRELSNRFRQELRGSDLLARIGGEEFAALLTQTPLPEALQIAERLRAAARDTVIDADGEAVARSVSIGAADCDPAPIDLEQLLRDADAALYRAKDAGRDCVCS